MSSPGCGMRPKEETPVGLAGPDKGRQLLQSVTRWSLT